MLKWFPSTEVRRPNATWAAEQLQGTLNDLSQAIYFREPDGRPNWDRRDKASQTVGKATGLNIAVQQLERQFAAKKLHMDRRPHHRVIVKSAEDGTKVPETLRLQTLLSSADRDTDTVGAEAGRAESSIVALFNLYERMGFAMDIAATDSLGQTVTQRQLLTLVRKAGLEQFFNRTHTADHGPPIEKHYVYVLTPREPDSEYRGPFPDGPISNGDYAWVGCAFLRLAVVPESFHELILAYLDGNKESGNTSKSTDLRDWLSMRGIETASPDEMAPHIASLPAP